MIAIWGGLIGLGVALALVAWRLASRGPVRPPRRNETCPACRHDLVAHQMAVGATKCQCCLRSRGLAQKNR